MILIYSKDTDEFINQVIDYLDEDFIRISDGDNVFIENVTNYNFTISSKFFNNVDLKLLKSIWFNGGIIDTKGNAYENECYGIIIESFLKHISTRDIGKSKSDFEINKFATHLEAIKLGFKVPESLITGNKKNLIAFYEKFREKNGIICKRINNSIFYKNDDFVYDFSLTFRINFQILNSVPNNFAISFFQERILADFEIRVVFINSSFYSMAIFSFDNEIDYRPKLKSLKNLRVVPFELPEMLKEKIKNLFDIFNLNYGSVDLIYSNNEFYFLEINPTGQVAFVNNLCNFHLEKEIIKLLKNGEK